MSAVRLLVLGTARRLGRAHGYQIRVELESTGAHEWSNATSGSIYHALKALTREGSLLAHDAVPSASGGPPRTEYEVTEQGERAYVDLLRGALGSSDSRLDVLTAAVGLIDDLRRAEAIGLLRQRADALEQWRASIVDHLPPNADLDSWGPVGEVIGLWLQTAESRVEWTQRLIRRLEQGAFRMEGDPSDREEAAE